ncbi:hypothetical protein L7E55_08335 [Pelotomaculum isophthalicicum JI]|uniref:Uncharacterized protein n=1 Tax=Pelotomaculum isophthalicicum JI TaxID=947010 RepID=A0A9X4JT89_9FIRM|nr:hypothetical protein [Pelotomaculum isophthalicicum]MDF9408364.1 hypothetical protein [Pelotomaculum isophthalicicum JI]
MRKNFLSFGNILICAVLAMAVVFAAFPSCAAAAVGMKVRPGLGGLYKTDQPLELMVTVENSGPGFAGLLRVRHYDERIPDVSRFIIDVNVPADALAQYRMVIPGELAAEMPVVELVSGDLVLAKSRVEGAAVSGGRVALALSGEIMGSGLQAWLSKSTDSKINLKYLSPGELPADSLVLNAADIIMVDVSSMTALTDGQIRALKNWVYPGGTLVLFGGAGAGEGGVFSEISPVLVTRKKMVGGELAGLRSGGPLEVASGELVAGNALAVDTGVPVLASRELGRGQVFYCGAASRDLGSEAQGIWSALFGTTSDQGNVTGKLKRSSLPHINIQDNLTQASSYIPGLAGPPLPVLALLWLVYAAIVGPLLYFLLRRADRRDWAWALAPAVALVVAGCFYLLAPGNRLQNYLSQTLAIVEIFTPELAEVQAGASVVASKGGDFILNVAENMYALPAGNNGDPSIAPALVHQGGERISIDFNGIEYGTLKGVYAYGLQRGFGSIEGSIYLNGSTIEGDLVNKTGLDLRDSSLLLGGRAVKIGEFPAGGKTHIEETLERWDGIVSSPQTLLFGMSGDDQAVGPFFRERQMISSAVSQGYGKLAGIQFWGWHDGPPGVIEVAGKPGLKEEHGLVLVKQVINMDLKGEFHLPAGSIIPYSVDDNGRLGYGAEGRLMMTGRSQELIYDLRDAKIGSDCRIDALDFQTVQGQVPYSAEIYNRQQDKWEPLPGEGRKIVADELSRYLDDYKVRVKCTRTGDIYEPYPVWPGLAVEGACLL